MLFRQFVDDDLGCGSYLVGDPESGEAVLVDPSFAIEPYIEAAEAARVRIARVLETHTHADHLSGHGRLALEHGVPVSIHAVAGAGYPHDPFEDGDVLQVGSMPILVIHTPGHRPEHCALLAGDRILLTGDSLFVGDAARPDLAVAAREGAEALFGSLRRLAELPDDVDVYPGHVAGSLCGTSMSPDRSSTIGRERVANEMLSYDDVKQFVLRSASVSAPRPPTTERVVALNRGPWVPLPPPVEQLDAAGDAVVLDVRPAVAFAAGHVPRAINVPLGGGSFGTKAGFVLDLDERVVLHAASQAHAQEAARRLWAVGLLDVAGYVLAPTRSEQLATVGVRELKRLLACAPDEVQLVDVREPSERDDGYIPGSRNIPYRLLRETAGDALDANRPVVTICESGARAAIAASVLAREGFDARAVVGGGTADFDGDETVSFRRCGS